MRKADMSLDQSYLLENAAADADGTSIVITSVGTCRLADPLGAAAKILPIRRDLTNVYGFVHTSKEILQQLDVFEGRELPPELHRFICSSQYETPTVRGRTDLFFVEVSSQKEIHYRGHLLQINCLDRVFQDRRELFDTLFRHKYPQEREARARALDKLASFRDTDPVERSVLLESHVHITTRDELACDLQAILGRLPAPVVFACHIDVPDSSGRPLETRARLCNWMREICAENGYTLFDPAPQVVAYGRTRALAEEGRDTNHYTNEFRPVLGTMLFETYAQPLMRSRGAFVPAQPAPAQPAPRRPLRRPCPRRLPRPPPRRWPRRLRSGRRSRSSPERRSRCAPWWSRPRPASGVARSTKPRCCCGAPRSTIPAPRRSMRCSARSRSTGATTWPPWPTCSERCSSTSRRRSRACSWSRSRCASTDTRRRAATRLSLSPPRPMTRRRSASPARRC
jgi:hypothetical protein